MNSKLVLVSLLMSLVMQSTPPPAEGQPSSPNTAIWPWILGAATLGAGTWAYQNFRSHAQQHEESPPPLTPEEIAQQTLKDFKDCLRENKDSPVNQLGFPTECNEVVLAFVLAREAVNESHGVPRAQEILDRCI